VDSNVVFYFVDGSYTDNSNGGNVLALARPILVYFLFYFYYGRKKEEEKEVGY
jgi:hypothetical protein